MTDASKPPIPTPPKKRSIFQLAMSAVVRRESTTTTTKKKDEPPAAPSLTTKTETKDAALFPSSGPVRRTGRQAMSARLPQNILSSSSSSGAAGQTNNDVIAEVKMMEERPRAESDPTPEFASSLEKDFGFTVPEASPEEAQLPMLQRVPSKQDILEGRRASFSRRSSFNEDRQSINRRSLQLSSNLSASHLAQQQQQHMEQKQTVVEDQKDGGGRLKAATLDRLVEYVVTSNEFMEASQVSGFLLTYHAYVDAHGLLSALAARFDMARDKNDVVTQIRTLFVMQKWIEEHFYDFEDDELLLLGVARFAQSRLSTAKDGGDKGVMQLLTKLSVVQSLGKGPSSPSLSGNAPSAGGPNNSTPPVDDENDSGDEGMDSPSPTKSTTPASPTTTTATPSNSTTAPKLKRDQTMVLLSQRPPPMIAKDWQGTWAKLVGKPSPLVVASPALHKVEIARQLTLLEHAMYKKIAPTELISQATHKLETPPENVREMISHFNETTRFVAFTICYYTDTMERAFIYRKWIKIGLACLTLQNYNAVFEIMAGIHSVAVWRLKGTRGAQSAKTRKIQEQLEAVVSRRGNYRVYRELLARNVTPIRPSVPFIGAALADLSFLDLGLTDTLGEAHGDTLINFSKQRRVAQIIQVVRKFQDHPYALEGVSDIQSFLNKEIHTPQPRIEDAKLFEMSQACEAGVRHT